MTVTTRPLPAELSSAAPRTMRAYHGYPRRDGEDIPTGPVFSPGKFGRRGVGSESEPSVPIPSDWIIDWRRFVPLDAGVTANPAAGSTTS